MSLQNFHCPSPDKRDFVPYLKSLVTLTNLLQSGAFFCAGRHSLLQPKNCIVWGLPGSSFLLCYSFSTIYVLTSNQTWFGQITGCRLGGFCFLEIAQGKFSEVILINSCVSWGICPSFILNRTYLGFLCFFCKLTSYSCPPWTLCSWFVLKLVPPEVPSGICSFKARVLLSATRCHCLLAGTSGPLSCLVEST